MQKTDSYEYGLRDFGLQLMLTGYLTIAAELTYLDA